MAKPTATDVYECLPQGRYTRSLNILAYDPEARTVYAELEMINLDERLYYTALSYTWGNELGRNSPDKLEDLDSIYC